MWNAFKRRYGTCYIQGKRAQLRGHAWAGKPCSGPKGWHPAIATLQPYMDNDGLPRGAMHINLLCRRDVQVAQIGLEFGIGGLQVEESLSKIATGGISRVCCGPAPMKPINSSSPTAARCCKLCRTYLGNRILELVRLLPPLLDNLLGAERCHPVCAGPAEEKHEVFVRIARPPSEHDQPSMSSQNSTLHGSTSPTHSSARWADRGLKEEEVGHGAAFCGGCRTWQYTRLS